MSRRLPFAAGGLTAMLAICGAQPLRAQDQAAGAMGAESPEAVLGGEASDLILVTATRRATPLSRTPVAVTAIAADAARDANVTDVRQLNQLVSSLLVYSTASDANAVARIRGVGTVGDNAGLESSVAMFVDGVYRPRIGAGLTDLGEIERIEVLRGPQGTLFGRNSSAGLVSVQTRAPDFTLGAGGEITYGNYDLWRLAARVTGPVTDRIAFSLDGVSVNRDGYLHIVDAGGNRIGDTNDRNRYLLRGQLLLQPSAALSIRIIGDYTHRDESCCGAVYLDTGEETGNSPASATPNATNRIVTILQSLGTIFPNGATPYTQDRGGRNISITPGREHMSRTRDWGLSAEANLTLPGGTKLTGITAWRDYWSSDHGDQDYSTADLVYRDPDTYREFKSFTQELRAQGQAFGGRLDWLAGVYYAHETLVLRDDLRFGRDYGRFAACRLLAGASASASPLLALAPNCTSPVALGALSAQLGNAGLPAPVVDALTGGLATLGGITGGGDVDSRYYQKSDSIALFTHNIVHLTPRLNLTLGLRYTHEKKRFRASFDNDNGACAALQSGPLRSIATNPALGSAATLAGGILTLGCLGNSSPSLNALALNDRFSDGQLSGTAALSWQATDALMVYASYARGYKAGGYNLDRFELGNGGIFPQITPVTFYSPRSNGDAAQLRFGEETVNAYEIGVKFAGKHWTATVTGFRQEFTNFQLNTFNGTGFIVQNINGCKSALVGRTCAEGDVKAGLVSQGVELELGANPVPGLSVRGSLTYADTRYADRLVGSRDGRIPLDPALFLLEGRKMFNTPDIVVTASATWTPDIGNSGLNALFHVDGRLTADTNAGADLYPEKAQDGYFLLGARIGLRGPDRRWALEFWGQNLLDTRYSQVIFNSPLQSTGPNNQSVAQLNGTTSAMANQLFSGYIGEPRTYGVTLRWKI
ncbi:MAG: TonB-dependent receptor [Sphingobium sp.]